MSRRPPEARNVDIWVWPPCKEDSRMWMKHGLLQSRHHNADAIDDIDLHPGVASGITDVQQADRS